jgi:soluble P-type ATPase
MFGCDDWDLLKLLSKSLDIHFITADKKGFDIIERRIVTECNYPLTLVSHLPQQRWEWIKATYPDKKIIFMGDGCFDYYSIKKSSIGITTIDSLKHVQKVADIIVSRRGADRAVAEAVLAICEHIGIELEELSL